MSELFIELFSEEMPATLQVSARDNLLQSFKDFFEKENIYYDNECGSFSTPNRLLIYFKKIQNEIKKKPEEHKGPNIKSSKEAINGFIKSNNLNKKDIYKKKIDKNEFYFYKSKKKIIKTENLLKKEIPILLSKLKWKKSMRWNDYDLLWGRPLKSIMAIFNSKLLSFNFYHLKSVNYTYTDKYYEEGLKIFKNYNSYISYFKKLGVYIKQKERRLSIENKLLKISNLNNFKLNLNEKLINEVNNLVEKPNIILCSFDKKYLNIPKELIITTIENYQKFFPVYDLKNNLTNNFFIISDNKDLKGLIKKGNESVIEARLSDAEYFWKKNKSENMLKQISQLKKVNYFNGLGNYFDKSQRLKKLSGLVSDELLISKEKIEIASAICKVDLLSSLVNEFPELQGILGSYFAEVQGFEKEVCLAVKEQYLPSGLNSTIPKKNYSIALSLSDKLDTLVGFFGLEIIPSSSKDPYALRRLTIGLIKIVIENKKNFKLREMINYSCQLYNEQFNTFNSKKLLHTLSFFIRDRFKNFMKEKGIRHDIIESSVIDNDIDKLYITFLKAKYLNKIINKEVGLDLIKNYKRAQNILMSEKLINQDEILGTVDPALFKNGFENDLYNKINDIRKNFTSIKFEKNYEFQLSILASAKKEVSKFFENVIVNDQDDVLKKNRLELLKMLCKTFDYYLNFSKIEISS